MWIRSLIGALLLIAWPAGSFAQQATPNAGAIPYHYYSAASDNSTLVKGSIGNVYDVIISNIADGTVYYFKFFDKATAPVCGTDIPVHTYVLPGNHTNPIPFVIDSAVGIQFYKGIGFCIVANQADTDDTSAATGITVDLNFK